MPDQTAEAQTPVLTIRDAVATAVANVGPRTRAAVVEHFAEIEAKKQAAAIIKGLEKLTEFQRELSKIRPAHTAYNAEGQPVGEPTFTKDQVDQRKKLTEQISKLEAAVNKADDAGDFGDLYNLTK